MPAVVEHRPVDDVRVVTLGEAANAAEVATERGEADGDVGRLGRRRRVGVLVVEAGR
jgi:hypothetical protein